MLRNTRRRACFSVLALLALSGPAGAAELDWCAPVAVRPDQYLRDAAACTPSFSDAELGASADVVLLGEFTDVASPTVAAPSRACTQSPSHAANAPYVQRLRAAARGRPLAVVHMHRFELVPYTLADQPGFSSAHLLAATQSWAQVTGFFSNDRSGACGASGCRLIDSWKGLEGKDAGQRLRDFIDRSGGSGAYQRVVYYLARPDGTDVFYPTAALANLSNPAYRAWRVREAGASMGVGGYDAIDLNHKLHQYQAPHWIGTSGVRDVATLESRGDTFWTAQPVGYGYSTYVQGWHALAQEMRQAGVPYSVTIALRAWGGDSFDDKSTTSLNEADLVRDVLRNARIVLLDRPRATTAASLEEKAVADLTASGVRVVLVDQTCGLAVESRLQPPAAPSVTR